jgi:hypothetical protein
MALQKTLRVEYSVHDDAREYVFWMQRFVDSQLMPGDLIAHYFESVTPWGYAALYHVMAKLGIEPLLFSKLLPLPLGITTTIYCFGVCLQVLPVPLAGFITSLLLNQNLWIHDDLISGCPRGFLNPLLLGFLYYQLKGSVIPALILIVLQALFYPPSVLVSVGILFLQLWRWEAGKVHISQNQRDYWLGAIALGLVSLILLPYSGAASEFGPVVNGQQAFTMPEFWAGGVPSLIIMFGTFGLQRHSRWRLILR